MPSWKLSCINILQQKPFKYNPPEYNQHYKSQPIQLFIFLYFKLLTIIL